jgi:hypothetical protein
MARNTSRVEGHARAPKWGPGRMTSRSIIHMNLHKPNNKLVNVYLEHFWCTNKSRANTDSQDSPRPGLGEATTFPLIVIFVPNHGAYTQMSFCPETPNLRIPKFSKLGLPQLWRPIISCANLWLR